MKCNIQWGVMGPYFIAYSWFMFHYYCVYEQNMRAVRLETAAKMERLVAHPSWPLAFPLSLSAQFPDLIRLLVHEPYEQPGNGHRIITPGFDCATSLDPWDCRFIQSLEPAYEARLEAAGCSDFGGT